MPYKDKKRKFNAWRAVVTKNGNRYTQGFPTKQEAIDWEREIRKKLEKEEKLRREGTDLMTFCTKYLDYSTRFSTTVYNEKKSVCRRFINYFGADTYAEEITTEQVEAYLFDQRKKRSANSANVDRKNLLAMWNKGCKTYGIKNNPIANTEKFRHDRKPPYVPSIEDVLKLIAAATRKEAVFLDCYLQTGARRSEIFRLLWEDVDLTRRTIRIGTRKTRDGSMQYRMLDISDDLLESLTWWWSNRSIKNSPYVFVDDQPGPHYGKPYTERRQFMKGLCKRANIKPFGFHSLRRFVASVLDSKRVPIRKIQLVLGHSRPTTTDRYIGDIHSTMRDTMNMLSLKKIHQDHTPKAKRVTSDD